MSLQIVTIAERGVAERERLHLRVLTDMNLNFSIVIKTKYLSPTGIDRNAENVFWFPSTLVKAGDHVVLYSKSGTATTQKNEDGTTVHFFYWGLKNTIWSKTGDCAVVFQIRTWQTSKYE